MTTIVSAVFITELVFYALAVAPKYKYIGKRGHPANTDYKHIRLSCLYTLTIVAAFIILRLSRSTSILSAELICNILLVLIPEILEYLSLLGAKRDVKYNAHIYKMENNDL